MKVIIDIPDDVYEKIIEQYECCEELHTRPNLYEAIANGEPYEDDWISVNDRLPEINEDVVVSDIETVKTYSGWYVGNGLWECDNGVFEGRVTHWKPFPKPCEVKKNDMA